MKKTALIASLPSDCHTWNLVYLELLLKDIGFRTSNLGACVPLKAIVDSCSIVRPDVVVLSSVNGHGMFEGKHAIRHLRQFQLLRQLPIVIGGRLTIESVPDDIVRRELVTAGFSKVFLGACAVDDFRRYLAIV